VQRTSNKIALDGQFYLGGALFLGRKMEKGSKLGNQCGVAADF